MPDVMQREYDRPFNVTAVVAAGAANVSEITLTVRNANGRAVSYPTTFDLWLSDSAVGAGLSASTTSGAVTVKTAGTTGVLMFTYLAKFYLQVQTLATGVFILSITDTNKVAFKIAAQIDGITFVPATLATASYG